MSIGAQRATRPIYRSSRNYTELGTGNLACWPQTRGDPCRRPGLSGSTHRQSPLALNRTDRISSNPLLCSPSDLPPGEMGSKLFLTLRWREMDSNFPFRVPAGRWYGAGGETSYLGVPFRLDHRGRSGAVDRDGAARLVRTGLRDCALHSVIRGRDLRLTDVSAGSDEPRHLARGRLTNGQQGLQIAEKARRRSSRIAGRGGCNREQQWRGPPDET